jgi:hypothetical protein
MRLGDSRRLFSQAYMSVLVELITPSLVDCCQTVWEGIVVRAQAGIVYHGVASLIPLSHLPTLSVVGEGEGKISIKH